MPVVVGTLGMTHKKSIQKAGETGNPKKNHEHLDIGATENQ